MKPLSRYKRILFLFCTLCRPQQRGPVKQIFSVGMVAALLTAGTFAFMQNERVQNEVIITSTTDSVLVGKPFFVDVLVDAADDVNAVDLEIDYPDTHLTVDNLREGESVLTIWTEEPTAQNGRITLRGGTFRRGFSGEHMIIRIRGIATRPGRIDFTFATADLVWGDGEGSQVSSDNIKQRELSVQAVSSEEAESEGVLQALQTDDLRTDLTGDRQVMMADISVFLQAWGSEDMMYDFNGDGRMNFQDFSIILADYFRFR